MDYPLKLSLLSLLLPRRCALKPFALVGGALLVCVAAIPASAQQSFTWEGTRSDAWTDTCNWQPPPVESCNEQLPYPGESSDADVVTVQRLEGGPGIVLLPESITLAELNVGEGGTINGPDTATPPTLTVTGGVNWSGGQIGDIRLVLASTSLSTISGPLLTKTLNLGTIVNHGALTWTGGDVMLMQGASFENRNFFAAATSDTFKSLSCCFVFLNSGQLVVPVVGGDVLPAPLFNNVRFEQEGGTIEVATGAALTVAFGTHSFSNSPVLDGGGRTVFTLGEFDVDGLLHVNAGHTLLMERDPQSSSAVPIIKGIGAVEGSGTLLWTGGTFRGDITVGQDVAVRLEGNDPKTVERLADDDPRIVGHLTLEGDTEWSGTGDILLGGESVLENRGTFTAQSDAGIEGLTCCSGQPPMFYHADGSFVKDGGSGTTLLSALSFVQEAPVVDRTGVVELGFGPHAINDGAAFEGAGRTRITDGSATLTGDVEVAEGATLEVAPGVLASGGQLYGAGTIGGEGTFIWTGGTIGGDLVLGPTLAFDISGPEVKTLQRGSGGAGRLVSNAQGVWRGGDIVLSGSADGAAALFVNAGTLAIESHATVSSPSCCSPPVATFRNEGEFVRHNDADTTRFVSVLFENLGGVVVEDGALEFGFGPSPVQYDGTFLLSGGDLVARDSLALLGGRFGGTGTAAALVVNRGATVAPGDVAPNDSVGTLTVTEYLQAEGGRLEIELGGTASGAFDRLAVEQAATLAGTLEAQSAGGFTPAAADTFRVVTADAVSDAFGTLEAPEGWEVFATYGGDHVLLGVTTAVSSEPGPEDGPPSETALPAVFAVDGVSPNPFAAQARLFVDLPWSAEVTLDLYDVVGRRVLTMRQTQPAGARRALTLDGSGLGSGVYLYRLTAVGPDATEVVTGKAVVVR